MSKTTVELNVPSRIAACIDNESSRYALGHVKLTPRRALGGAWATATDGRKLSIVPCDGKCDQSEMMPGEVAPTAIKHFGKGGESASISLNGNWATNYGKEAIAHKREDIGRFPRAPEVLPQLDGEFIAFTIDPQFIADLAQAICGGDMVGMTFLVPLDQDRRYKGAGVAVRGGHGFGVIMPLKSDGNQAGHYRADAVSYAADYQTAQENE